MCPPKKRRLLILVRARCEETQQLGATRIHLLVFLLLVRHRRQGNLAHLRFVILNDHSIKCLPITICVDREPKRIRLTLVLMARRSSLQERFRVPMVELLF